MTRFPTNSFLYFRHTIICDISGARDYYLTDDHLIIIKAGSGKWVGNAREDRNLSRCAIELWTLLSDAQKGEILLEYRTEKDFDEIIDERQRISTREKYRTDLAFTRMSDSKLTRWAVETALAMSPLGLPAYVILWILQACGSRITALPELRCLQKVAESRRQVIRGRLGAD